jgi:hypothetical protein
MSKVGKFFDYETSAIDALYLELSQFTNAKTSREIDLQKDIDGILFDKRYFTDCRTCARYVNDACYSPVQCVDADMYTRGDVLRLYKRVKLV